MVMPGADQEVAAWKAGQHGESSLAVVDQTGKFLGMIPARRLLHRLPWLAVGLLGALLVADLVAGYEGELKAYVALAFFLPGIVYLADAVGTQTETLVAACACATLVALVLPMVLQRLRTDPAYGSGPLATVIQDLLSILIYLQIARLIL